MPAYTSISFLFEKPIPDNIVEKFYREFMSDDIKFKSVMAWGCPPNMSLKNIIDWNQNKIDENFIPDGDTDVSHYERQIYLNVEPFTECRLILSSEKNTINFRCIVPECEITSENSTVFEKAALRIWNFLPVKRVETYPEINSFVEPAVELFAILDEESAKMPSSSYYLHESVNRGVMLKPNKKITEPIIFLETKRITKNAQVLVDLEFSKINGKPRIGSPLDQAGLSNGESVVCDYITHSELSLAIEHLIYMVEETDIKLEAHDFKQLSRIADDVGLDFPTET
jgi:hypothetical protein